MSKQVILCVEDNMQVQMFNKPLLEAKGYTVKLAMTLAEAREVVWLEMPGLIILDIHLPDGNGLDFLRELRSVSELPVIALTNSKEEQDQVAGFANGCDDYVTKPYTFPVLYARIERLLQRAATPPILLEKGTLKLNLVAGQAFIDGQDIRLTQKEFSLLLFLMQHEGKPLSAELVYEKVWKQPMASNDSAVKNTIYKLRKKLYRSGYSITNLRGTGYCFEKI